MRADAVPSELAVLLRARNCLCAVALESVIETMRPLPVEPLSGMPAFVQGLSIIRGESVPVVNLSALFDGPTPEPSARFVLLRADRRHVALAVDAVLGVVQLTRALLQEMPPLLKKMNNDLMTEVAVRDGQLLRVLQAARLVPEATWQALASREVVS